MGSALKPSGYPLQDKQPSAPLYTHTQATRMAKIDSWIYVRYKQ